MIIYMHDLILLILVIVILNSKILGSSKLNCTFPGKRDIECPLMEIQ